MLLVPLDTSGHIVSHPLQKAQVLLVPVPPISLNNAKFVSIVDKSSPPTK